MEGKCLGTDGFVVMIHHVDDNAIGKGQIEQDTGSVKYRIKFRALVFRPFRNEVLDAIVFQATDFGVFARAGPLEIFITRKLMPEELRDGFDTVKECYIDHTENTEVKSGTRLRVKILGVKYQLDRIEGTATMLGDFLGPQSD